MGNLNSRETMQLLENEEFKHVCKNLGDLLRHHGEYMQHRRHKSRKHRSHRGESKDRGRGESGEVSPELVKDLGWKCPGGVGCPMYKFVREQFRRNPPAEGESRHNINQNHHPRSSEPRYLMPHPPQPNRERNPSGRRRSQRFPNPQNDPSNWLGPERQHDQHPSYPHPPFNDLYFPGPDPDRNPNPEIDPQAMPGRNHPNFRPAHATTASTSSSSNAGFYASALPHHGPPDPRHATRSRVRGNRGPPPLAMGHPPHEQFNTTAAAGGRSSSSNRGFEFERDSPRRGQRGEERNLGSGGGGMAFRHGFPPPPSAGGGGGRRLDPGRRTKRKYGPPGAALGTADPGVAAGPGPGPGPGLGFDEDEAGAGFWGSSPSRMGEGEEEEEEEGERSQGAGENADEAERG